MSTKYQKPYVIPEGFPALLKAFTREILRAQPPMGIYEFGAQYFENLLARGMDGTEGEMRPDVAARSTDQAETSGGEGLSGVKQVAGALDMSNLQPADLEPVIMQLFLQADADSSGFLDRNEFSAVLKSAELKLSERQIRELLAEADENDDNVIEYREFVPFMVDILQGIKASETAQVMMAEAESLVRDAVEQQLLHGMSRPELEALMLRIFRKADTDQSGMLSRGEFKNCLKAAKLGLTRKDINLIMSTVDVDKDGQVSYEEFIPICFQVLVERFKDEIVTSNVLSNKDGLQGMLLQAFQAADPEEMGQLPQAKVKEVLKKLSYEVLGLSSLQLVTLLSQAPMTGDGMVQYVPFVPIASAMVYSMYDVDSIKLKMQAIQEVADAGGIAQISSMDVKSLRDMLEALFKEADTEGTGQLSLPEVMQVLERLGSLQAEPESMQLSDAHMRAMFTAIDADESGRVDWFELVSFICDVMEHLERERYIAQVSRGGPAGGAAGEQSGQQMGGEESMMEGEGEYQGEEEEQ